jgi:hypothetical protein
MNFWETSLLWLGLLCIVYPFVHGYIKIEYYWTGWSDGWSAGYDKAKKDSGEKNEENAL